MRALAESPSTPAVALLCGLVFVFKPAQMFEANAPFVYFGFAQIALLLVPVFAVTFALASWLASRGGQRSQQVVAPLLGGLALAAWIHASFVGSPGGALDGRSVVVPYEEEHFRLNLLLFAGFVGIGAALAWRFPALARRFLLALFAVLTAQAAWIAANDDHPWRAASTGASLAGLSSEKNVIVVLLDAFQSDFFSDVLERDPQLARAFDGFTYYADAVGPAPTTYLAMPAIHSGIPYREGERLLETYRRSVVERSFMAQLAARGYDAMLVNPMLNHCPVGVACDHEGVVVQGRARSLAQAAAFLVDLALFRIVPDAFKHAVYAEGAWMTTRLLGERRSAFWFDAVTSNKVLELFARSMHVDSPRPVVRFLHLFSTHSPASVDAGCREVRNFPWVRQTALAQAQCAVSGLAAMLHKLQALGIYDRSAVVVLADHGAGMPKDATNAWVWGAYASPLFLAKPFGARGPLARSVRVVGVSDVPASVCSWTADCRMESGSDVARVSAHAPSYPFFLYYWRHEYWVAQSVPIVARYEVRGPPGDSASWVRLQ